jgi:hypothetical protein
MGRCLTAAAADSAVSGGTAAARAGQRTVYIRWQRILNVYRGPSYDLASPTPPPTSLVSNLSLFLSLPMCRLSSLLQRDGWWGWERSQMIRRRESMVLFIIFNTLCSVSYILSSYSVPSNNTMIRVEQNYKPPTRTTYCAEIFKQSMWTRNRVGIGLSYRPARARTCKSLWSPGIDSEESISPAYVACRVGTTNRVVVPARQAGNRFLGSLKGLQIRALAT